MAQIWSDQSPQGYSCRMHGEGSRRFVDFDGITLAMKTEEGGAAEKNGSE